MTLRITGATALKSSTTIGYTPASLFVGGEQGVWYDPSDLSTMFQDATKMTPVTAVEQPVGCILDKRAGSTRTGTPIDNNCNTATWTKGTGWSSPSARSLVCNGTQTGNSDASASYVKPDGSVIRWTFNITAISGTLLVYSSDVVPESFTTTGIKVVYSSGAGSANVFRMGAGETCTITDLRIEVVVGNDAFQATAANRPTLSARVNLLTKTEDFSDAAWAKANVSVTTNSAVAPNGTLTADTLDNAAGAGNINESFGAGLLPIGTYTASCYFKAGTTSSVKIDIAQQGYAAGGNAEFNLSAVTATAGNYGSTVGTTASITAVGDGWYLCKLTSTTASAATNNYVQIRHMTNGTIYAWGADFRSANDGVSLPVYQRVNTSSDYDTTGFPLYLSFDGSNDALATGNVDFSATDKMTAFAGVRKLSDVNYSCIAETLITNTGAFGLFTASGSSGKYYLLLNGTNTSGSRATTDTVTTVPNTDVVTVNYNIGQTAANEMTARIDGAASTLTLSGDAGTGNFGNHPLYIGARTGNSFYLTGRIYSLIIRGAASTTKQIQETEAWINKQTKAY